MSDFPRWQRLLVALVMLVGSVWFAKRGLETFEVECAPDAAGTVWCRFEESYAGLTWREELFAPARDRLTWRKTGKNDYYGEIDIHLASGDKVTIARMTAREAEEAFARLHRDPRFALQTKGPRWGLLFLLIMIPIAVVCILPDRADDDTSARPGTSGPSKKERRAERGRQRKAADRGGRSRRSRLSPSMSRLENAP